MAAIAKNLAECPECGSDIRFRKTPFVGKLVECHECYTELIVVSLSPLELDVADGEYDDDFEDDWADDFDSTTERERSRRGRMQSGGIEKWSDAHSIFD